MHADLRILVHHADAPRFDWRGGGVALTAEMRLPGSERTRGVRRLSCKKFHPQEQRMYPRAAGRAWGCLSASLEHRSTASRARLRENVP
jgi:hypothetical protein